MNVKRLYVIVLDSFGVGALPDAADFGDGSDVHTLQTIVKSPEYRTPHLAWLGLFNIDGAPAGTKTPKPAGAFGRMAEKSRGKDTTTGHWEIAGLVSEQAMPTFPEGFPPDLIAKLEAALGRKTLCHKPYSGTAGIHRYGRAPLATGSRPRSTSADIVRRIAAHESIVPREALYDYCRKARAVCEGPYAVGRVIARPFIGEYPNYERTAGRHDFSLLPPGDTMLDAFQKAGLTTIGVGKISDIFAARGVGRHIPMDGNEDGMNQAIKTLSEEFTGLCFVNLVDFDMKYGHRRDIDGYAKAATVFDRQLGDFVAGMQGEDVLMITADHGCDPGAPGTDHTREYVPILAYGPGVKAGVNLGTRATFADVAATAAEMFSLSLSTPGKSFWQEIAK